MSAAAETAIINPDGRHASNEALGQGQPARSASQKDYKGFIAGVGSGIAKLSGMNETRNPPASTISGVAKNVLDLILYSGPSVCC